MAKLPEHRRLADAYIFPGFRPPQGVKGMFGDPKARLITLVRRGKTVCGDCRTVHHTGYDRKRRRVRDLSCTAYLLKESFGQLGDYEHEAWACKFFDNWRANLKWQRLKPYEKFTEMIERHWDGIAAYCQPGNKVSPGFIEGLNNKIRIIQRCALWPAR